MNRTRELERALAGMIMLDHHNIMNQVDGLVAPEDFQDALSRQVFLHAKSAYDKGEQFDLLIAADSIKNSDAATLASMTDAIPSASIARDYAQRIRLAASERRLDVETKKILSSKISKEEKIARLEQICSSERFKTKNTSETNDPIDILGGYAVTEKYVSSLGKEKWLYPNLVISGHILVLIAMTGGGKTTFLFYEVAPHMVRTGATVFYVDADSPPSEHQAMKRHADEAGFMLINPTTQIGKSVKDFVVDLQKIVDSGADLTGTVFIFDTLKKFTDLMSKAAVKDFFSMCRTMNSRGATCIFSAHANKYRDSAGHLIPEGVGDVKNDCDDLIIFERQPRPSGGIDITSTVDIDSGAKVRGIFEPFSFSITEKREILLCDRVIEMPDYRTTKTATATDEEILEAATDLLRESPGEAIPKSMFAKNVHDKIGTAGLKRIRQVITANAEKKRNGTPTKRFVYSIGARGAQLFEAGWPEKSSLAPR